VAARWTPGGTPPAPRQRCSAPGRHRHCPAVGPAPGRPRAQGGSLTGLSRSRLASRAATLAAPQHFLRTGCARGIPAPQRRACCDRPCTAHFVLGGRPLRRPRLASGARLSHSGADTAAVGLAPPSRGFADPAGTQRLGARRAAPAAGSSKGPGRRAAPAGCVGFGGRRQRATPLDNARCLGSQRALFNAEHTLAAAQAAAGGSDATAPRASSVQQSHAAAGPAAGEGRRHRSDPAAPRTLDLSKRST
jgi:hypothetical protein